MSELRKNAVFQSKRLYYGIATKNQRFSRFTQKKLILWVIGKCGRN